MTATDQLRAQVQRVTAGLSPELMTGAQCAAGVEDLATVENMCASARLFLALRVAETDAWRGQGHASAADWLAAKAGISVSAAHAQLGTARRARKMPKTKKAMDDGELSPDQAGAVADGAAADPEAEDELLDSAANDTNKTLKEKAAKAKTAAMDSAERDRQVRRSRTRRIRLADGAGSMWIQGPAADMAKLAALLKPFEEELFRRARTHNKQRGGVDRDSYDNRQYDALMAFLSQVTGTAFSVTLTPPAAEAGAEADAETKARSAETDEPETGHGPGTDERDTDGAVDATDRGADATGDHGHGDTDGDADVPEPWHGSDGPAARANDLRARPADPDRTAAPSGAPPGWVLPAPAGPALKLPGGDNTKVIVLIDHTALLRGHTTAGETCEIAGIGPIPVTAAKELMADAFLAAVITKGRDVINVAHLGRGLNAHQRTAIEALGLRCNNIACNRTIALQIDHRTPYADDPITELDNSDPLCPDNCHRLKTHHGWHLEEGTGPRRFLPPGHPDNPLTPKPDTGTDEPDPGLDDESPFDADGHVKDPNRILTEAEADQLEANIKQRLAWKQTSLC